MKIEFYNCPEPQEFNSALIKDAPAFLSYQPNFKEMEEIAQEYQNFKNIVIIGHGGSITSIYGMYNALLESTTKKLHMVCTVDPDYIRELKSQLDPKNTLVIAVSKSGETVTQIEALLHFTEFPLLVIASSVGSLSDIAHKLSARIMHHPPISGRFSGFSEVALLPALLCGLNVSGMLRGAEKIYGHFFQNNDAYRAASIMQQLEDKGIVDVFLPIYDWHLFPLNSLIIQLCHESFGKEGEGQTYFAHHAPESQHHMNQRFFGGRKNIAGWFLSTEQPLEDSKTIVPENLQDISLKDHTLGVLEDIPLSKALRAELEGTLEDAKLQNIPVVLQTLTKRTPEEVGSLIAFWHLYAVYSSLLRNVDPFNQPQVENSKKISFAKRLQQKGIL